MKNSINKLSAGLLLAGLLLAATTSANAQEYTFTTLAGLAGSSGSADGTGSAARFNQPYGVAVDSAGNAYVADTGNNTIRKVTPGGVATTLAGLAGGAGSADGTGSAARFYGPSGVAVDSAGTVYVADTSNNTIRKVTPGGVATTLAGLAGSGGSADGTGSAARFYGPRGVAVDSAGNLYVADAYNHTIRKVTPGGAVTTLAGNASLLDQWGSPMGGYADGTGSAARFWGPSGVAVDGAGNVYVADGGNSTIRKVTPGGVVTTLAGLAGGAGSTDGTGSSARFYFPQGVAVDSAGNVYVADRDNHTIRKVTPGGVVTTLAGLARSGGSADGTGSAARFNQPYGVAVDSAGNVYVADTGNHTIRMGIAYQGSPVVRQQPANQTVEAGGTATFSVVAGGSSPLAYQWSSSCGALPGATNAILTLPAVSTNQSGCAYWVVVTNAYGTALSSNASLAVLPVGPLSALIIWDVNDTNTRSLSNALYNAGITVTLSATPETSYNGANPSPFGFGAVIHLNGTTYTDDMPVAGQIALSNYVYHGGGYIQNEWDAYEYLNGRLANMRDLILFDRAEGGRGAITLGVVAGQETHPVLAGLSSSFTFQAGYNIGHLHTFPTSPATVLMRQSGTNDAVAVRQFGSGHVVGFHHSGNYEAAGGFNTLSDANVQRLYVNAAFWAGSAVNAPPTITVQPQNQTVSVGTAATYSVGASGTVPLGYHWRRNGSPIAGATQSSYTLVNCQLANSGSQFSCVVTNAYGVTTSAVATLTVSEPPPSPDFQIIALRTNNSRVVDHDTLTSDDRGGIAVSTSQAFVTGDGATARFSAADLSGGTSLGIIRDSLCADLRTETVYLLGNGSTPLTSAGGTVTTLIELNGATGQPTGTLVPLSAAFTLPSSGNGIFSGYGRVVVHNGTRVYDVFVPSGFVVDRGPMARPAWYTSESWSVWGAAEYFGETLYLTYRESGTQRIVRSRVGDGAVSVAATFTGLSDMASFTVSPSRSRWYFHYEGSGQFGGTSETLGYADAQLSYVSTNPPVILSQPVSQTNAAGGTATFSVSGWGSSPLAYEWRSSCGSLRGATNALLSLPGVSTNQSGCTYWVVVTNAYGVTNSAVATLTVVELGAFSDDFEPNIDLLQWSTFGGTVGTTALATNYGGSHSGPNSLWFGDAGSRYAASRSLNTMQGGVVDFWLRIANGGSVPWEQADLPDEGIVLEYSVNSGSSWVEMGRYDTSAYTVWTHIEVDIPVAAQAANTQFRWRQLSNSGNCCDHWALDNVGVGGPRPPAIVRQALTQTAEIGSVVGLQVQVTNARPGTVCQWYFNGTNALAGATNASLNLAHVLTAQAGIYTLVVSSVYYRSVTSAPAVLSVIPAVQKRPLVALSVTGETGSLLHLEFANALAPSPTWQALGALTLTNPPQLYFDRSAPLPSSRFYRAWQTNTPSVRPTLGLGLATELMLTGLPGSTVRVDWINQFGPTDAWIPLAAVTLTSASQPYVDLTMFGQPPRLYRLVLIAAPPPAIVRQPLTQTAELGSVAGFRVGLTNAAPGTVCQWYFNGTPLAGTTNTSLKLSNAQAAQIGTYTVVVSNAYGAVTSAPALINVIPAVPRRTVAAVYLTGDLGSLLHLDYTGTVAPAPAWQTLASLTLTNPPQLWLDLTDPMPAARFYRVWQAETPIVLPAADLALATELTLTGTPGTNLRVDWINQFGPTNAWVTLATVPLTSASQTYVDVTMIRQPPRLYRLVPVP